VRYQPDVLLLMGDNVYGDCQNTSCVELREAYRVFESLPSVRGAAPQLATLATLDDHDYGQDDCHGDNPYKEIARGLFQQVFHHLGELPVNGGVYRAWSVGPSGQRLQVILLDTRYGRSPFDLHADNESGMSGLHQPTDREEQHMLSDYQWDWLGAQLEEPADLRLIVSSIQVLNEVTRYECWRHLPRERERLFQLLEGFGSDLILLSGDRHMGGFYQTNGTNSTLTEVTASAWTHSFSLAAEGDAACTALLCDEIDPSRLDDLVHENNWGTLEIDWELRTYQLALRRSDTTYGVSYLNPEYHKGTDAGAILQSYDFNF
jgi:alkaline phosphatase D